MGYILKCPAYFFKCPKCRQYKVTKETFQGFITPKKWAMLKKAMAGGAIGGRVSFPQYCPKCRPEAKNIISVIKVEAIWLEKNEDPVL